MFIEYSTPSITLRPYIRAYYRFRIPAGASHCVNAELGNIRVLRTGNGVLTFGDGNSHLINRDFVIGPTNSAYFVRAETDVHLFGAGLRPRGWACLLGIDAYELSSNICALSEFAGADARIFRERLQGAANMSDCAIVADNFFFDRMRFSSAKNTDCITPISEWLLRVDNPSIDELVDSLGVSRRQTDRLAKRFFGASPNVLGRKYRALRAADRLRSHGKKWRVAAGESYYDQAHFIKEFRTFVGTTPSAFIKAEASLVAKMQHERAAAAIHAPLAGL